MIARLGLRGRGRARALAVGWVAVAAALALTGCGADDDADDEAADEAAVDEQEATDGQDDEADGPSDDGALTGVCPDPVVIQTGWFPQAEVAPLYELIGPGGDIDPARGVYSGPLGDTGVTAEIRSGGPYLGEQSVDELMYQDRDILLGTLNTDIAIRSHGRLPTTGVMALWDTHPLALTYDPESFDFDDVGDIAESDATVLYFAGSAFVDYLVGEGLVRDDQRDDSFTGALDRFVAAPDETVMHAVVTNEPWRLEHEVEAWGKPVESLLIHDTGYELYQAMAVRDDALDEQAACLERLVPLIQGAVASYLDDPAPAHDVLVDVVEEFDTFWTMPEELLDYAHDRIREVGVFRAHDGAFGEFDMARVDRMIELLDPIYTERGVDSYDPSVTAADLATNEFVDPDVK